MFEGGEGKHGKHPKLVFLEEGSKEGSLKLVAGGPKGHHHVDVLALVLEQVQVPLHIKKWIGEGREELLLKFLDKEATSF